MEDDKKEKKSYLRTFLIILITMILTAIIIIGLLVYYIMTVNPFNIQACVITSFLPPTNTQVADDKVENNKTGAVVTKPTVKVDNPLLSDAQEASLKAAGVDVSSLPSTISPELEACFTEKLGKERVEEIKAGATPGPLDILKGGSCL